MDLNLTEFYSFWWRMMLCVCGLLVTYNPDVDFFELQVKELSRQLNYLIIIDNSSIVQQELQSIVSITSGQILFKKLGDNLGLSAAQNIGIRVAASLNATHIVLFDQDSFIEHGFIDGLLEAETQLLFAGEKVGAVGPLFFDPDNDVVYPVTVYAGPFLKRVPLTHLEYEIEATFVIASGCLIRMKVLNAIGLMNERLFIDYIDVEWSLRAKKSGYNVYVTSRARMAHAIGDNRKNILGRTISVHSPLRRYYLIRNSFFMLRQDYIPFGYKLREVVFNLLRVLTGLHFSTERKKYLRYTFWGIRDGILGVLGSCKH